MSDFYTSFEVSRKLRDAGAPKRLMDTMSRACRQALEECRARPIVGRSVFVTEDGSPVSESTIRRYFSIAKQLAGITRRLRFHDLRHTFGSTLASAGVPLQIIAKALGHSTVRMSEPQVHPKSAKSGRNELFFELQEYR